MLPLAPGEAAFVLIALAAITLLWVLFMVSVLDLV